MTSQDQFEVFTKSGVNCLRVRIQPRACRNEIAGTHGNALKIRLTAPPIEDRANRQLLDFLSELLDLRKDQVSILTGLHSRTKTVGILQLTESEIVDRIAQYLV